MVLATNIKTEKDKNGHIIGYHLKDDAGRIAFYTSNQVKKGIADNLLIVDNLNLTSDNRLMPSKKLKKPRTIFGEYKPKDYFRRYGTLYSLPDEFQTEEVCAVFVQDFPSDIKFVINQTERLCLLAVSNSPRDLIFIRNQTLKVALAALKRATELEKEFYYNDGYVDRVWLLIQPKLYEQAKQIYNKWDGKLKPQTDTLEQWLIKVRKYRNDIMPIDIDPSEIYDDEDSCE